MTKRVIKGILSALILILSSSPILARQMTTPVPPEPIQGPNTRITPVTATSQLARIKKTITKSISAKEKHLEKLNDAILKLPSSNTKDVLEKLAQLRKQLKIAHDKIASTQNKEELQAFFKEYVEKQKKLIGTLKKSLILYHKDILTKKLLAKLNKLVIQTSKLVASLKQKGLATSDIAKRQEKIKAIYTNIESEITQISGNEDIASFRRKLQKVRQLVSEFKVEIKALIKTSKQVLSAK